MKPSDYIKTAFKNLLRQKMRTALTIFAIVIGAVSVTVMLSLIIAGKNAFLGSIESSGALKLVTVMPNTENEENDSDLFRTSWNVDSKNKLDDTTVTKLSKIPHVVAYTPVLSPQIQGIKIENGKKSFYSNVIGVDPTKDVFNVNLVSGRKLNANDTNKIVIADTMLSDFGFKGDAKGIIGKHVLFLTKGYQGVPLSEPDPPEPPQMPTNGNNKESQQAQEEYRKALQDKTYEIPVEVVGVMQSGVSSDSSLITLEYAKELYKGKQWGIDQKEMDVWQKKNDEFQRLQQQMNQQNQLNHIKQNQNSPTNQTPPQMPQQKLLINDFFTDHGYGSIMLKADKTENVPVIAKSIENIKLTPVTAQKMIDQFMKIFSIIGSILGGIGSISLFVASIGIINTMIMATYERTKEIGVLRACGAKRSTIRRLFTFESALLGFFGGLIGLVISFALATIGNQVLDNVVKQQSLPLQGLITLPLWLSFSVLGFTTVIGMLAGLYPAFRASRLDPITALRYE